jgi:hypothetical protein
MDASELRDDGNGSSPPELVGPLSGSDPFTNIKKALWEGFCAPRPVYDKTGRSKDPSLSFSKTKEGVEPRKPLLDHPFEYLKRALLGYREAGVACGHDEYDNSLGVARSYDSDDSVQKNLHEEEEDNSDLVVVLTRPGTSRLVHVQGGLETFLAVVVLLYLTYSALLYCDGSKLGMELHVKMASEEGSAYCSIAARP